jgi:non-homologous end joining protein Ku
VRNDSIPSPFSFGVNHDIETEAPEVRASNVVDLMAALKKSLG